MTPLEDSRRFAEEFGRILGLLADTTLRAVEVYTDNCRDDRPPDEDDRRAVMLQLVTVATAFRLVDAYWELVEHLPPEHDPKPALAVLRTVQDSLTLSLSDDPRDRGSRISEDDLRARLKTEPVKRFLEPSGTT